MTTGMSSAAARAAFPLQARDIALLNDPFSGFRLRARAGTAQMRTARIARSATPEARRAEWRDRGVATKRGVQNRDEEKVVPGEAFATTAAVDAIVLSTSQSVWVAWLLRSRTAKSAFTTTKPATGDVNVKVAT